MQLKGNDLNELVNQNSDGAFLYTYGEIDEDGYAITGTVVLRRPVLCSHYDNFNPSDNPHLNQNCDTINVSIPSGNTVFAYIDTSYISQSVIDNYSVKYNATIMTTEAELYTFILK